VTGSYGIGKSAFSYKILDKLCYEIHFFPLHVHLGSLISNPSAGDALMSFVYALQNYLKNTYGNFFEFVFKKFPDMANGKKQFLYLMAWMKWSNNGMTMKSD
jgi:hypothetical protein